MLCHGCRRRLRIRCLVGDHWLWLCLENSYLKLDIVQEVVFEEHFVSFTSILEEPLDFFVKPHASLSPGRSVLPIRDIEGIRIILVPIRRDGGSAMFRSRTKPTISSMSVSIVALEF